MISNERRELSRSNFDCLASAHGSIWNNTLV